MNAVVFPIFNLNDIGSTKGYKICMKHVDTNFTLVTDVAIASQALPTS